MLLLGRGSEKFQQIGGKSLACETDAQMIKEAISEYDKEKNRSRSAESVLKRLEEEGIL